MNTKIKSAILLIDNLLYNPQKFSRTSLSNKLAEEGLPSDDSTITRLLNFIRKELGIKIRVDRSKFVYGIDYEITDDNDIEQYNQYKSLYFRNVLQKTRKEHELASQYVSLGFTTINKNIELLNPLLNAILENRKVKLEYLPFYKEKVEKFIVSPLFIKEYLNRWYLITEKLEDRHPIFAIDRIESYEILKLKFKRTNEINIHTFKNTIGVSFENPLEKIKLWVSKYQYHYFDTLPFHSSQKIEQKTKDGFIISFQLTINYELKQWLLFFGNSIKVLEPLSLQKQIIDKLKSTLKQYKN